ncbi:hypothetical protein K3495_g9953 [Podosphaera aphanis]|nr:hypothetical protein K3495_g9953 [Podosphaera aphanis]
MSTRVSKKTKERMRRELPIRKDIKYSDQNDEFEVLFEKAAGPTCVTNERAFRVPVTLKTKKNEKTVTVSLPTSVAQVDQGSDMIIVTVGFLEKFGLPMQSLSSRGMYGLTMNVVDATSTRLTHYSQFEIGVLGIWRKVEAFVRPFSDRNADEVHLLLGLPWLHTVCAKIWVKKSIIEIGDTERGETVVKIPGPIFVEGDVHKLVLCPKTKRNVKFEEDISDDSDEDTDTDDEDSSDDEDLSDLFPGKNSGKKCDLSMS